MALLAGTHYDPGTAATKATSSLLAMTAIDTTNLRLTFTAPANGIVLVRLRCVTVGATTFPTPLLGVLDGATVRGRQAPFSTVSCSATATHMLPLQADFIVSGLTPGNSYTWDAAYGVETVVASSVIKWGGANTASGADAWAGFGFEIWETNNLLAGMLYDPGTAVVNKATSSLLAMTAFDTTNLRLVFTTRASGAGSTSVLVHMRCPVHGSTGRGQNLFGVLDGATVRARVRPHTANSDDSASPAATSHWVHDGLALVTGLSASTAYTWDAAYAVQVVAASENFKYGGPNNTTADDAWGGFAYEVWAA